MDFSLIEILKNNTEVKDAANFFYNLSNKTIAYEDILSDCAVAELVAKELQKSN